MSEQRILRGAVIGYPIEHSLSPILHRSAFEFLDITGSYERIPVQSGELQEFFEKAKSEYDYLSITMPLKEETLNLEVEVDFLARKLQTSNTLFKRNGQWHLTTTDGVGFSDALRNIGRTRFRSALVLGAGGTARAVVGALDGVSEKITVLGRTSTRRDVIEASVLNSEFSYERWSDSPHFEEYDFVVNTTPAGAADLLANAIVDASSALLFDVIYKPWPTVLASRWQDCGGEVINGSELLLYQGIAQLKLVVNQSFDEAELARILRQKLAFSLQ